MALHYSKSGASGKINLHWVDFCLTLAVDATISADLQAKKQRLIRGKSGMEVKWDIVPNAIMNKKRVPPSVKIVALFSIDTMPG
jgi:hypothetical protein